MARTDLWMLHLGRGSSLAPSGGVSPLGTLTGAQGWLRGSVVTQSCLGHAKFAMGWARAHVLWQSVVLVPGCT